MDSERMVRAVFGILEPASMSTLTTVNAADAEWIRIRVSAREIRMQLVPAIVECCSKASLAIIRAIAALSRSDLMPFLNLVGFSVLRKIRE
jgi:hypothetical protein